VVLSVGCLPACHPVLALRQVTNDAAAAVALPAADVLLG
jgi:hypothetical protein